MNYLVSAIKRFLLISDFGNSSSVNKNDFTAFFPFAFYIAVRQLYEAMWSPLLLNDHELSLESSALCLESLLVSQMQA
jgi:hypothetical protein